MNDPMIPPAMKNSPEAKKFIESCPKPNFFDSIFGK
jgi:hypothetical protein